MLCCSWSVSTSLADDAVRSVCNYCGQNEISNRGNAVNIGLDALLKLLIACRSQRENPAILPIMDQRSQTNKCNQVEPSLTTNGSKKLCCLSKRRLKLLVCSLQASGVLCRLYIA